MSSDADKAPEIVESAEGSGKTEKPENLAETATTTTGEENRKYFKTKKIRFGLIEYQIVTQNANGPCPLIAIINALVLKGKVVLATKYVLTSSELIELLANGIIKQEPDDEASKKVYQSNVDAVMDLMPKLVDGLDVNVKFSGVDVFEFTPALSLFDLVNVKLYHVWLPDPQFPDQCKLIEGLSYNELTEKMCSDDETVETEIIKAFHEDTLSQITFQGLASLVQTMKDGDIAVVFQNNHFSTIHKRRNEIFKLVSDEGLADEPQIVWETFSSVDGDSIFVNGDFNNFKPIPTPASSSSTSGASTVIHSTFEHQDDFEHVPEVGVEAVENPSSIPATEPPVVEAPPTSGAQTSRPTTSYGIQRSHQNVTPRGSQERKETSGNKCAVM